MKKRFAGILAVGLILLWAACAPAAQAPAAEAPAGEPAPQATEVPPAEEKAMPESFLWDDFQDRDPEHMPEVGPNGASIRESSWKNVRAKNDGGALKLDMRPPAFDGKTYESEDAYYAHADEWMADWGETVDMWSLEGIGWCRYLTIRVKGDIGGEERMLILDLHPQNARFYAVRFSDLVLKDGGHPTITREWQELTIDLTASGLPGMTDALHLRAFLPCILWLERIDFSEPLAPMDPGAVLAGLEAAETGKPGDLPIETYVNSFSACMLNTLG
jgi:hypothetical protein